MLINYQIAGRLEKVLRAGKVLRPIQLRLLCAKSETTVSLVRNLL